MADLGRGERALDAYSQEGNLGPAEIIGPAIFLLQGWAVTARWLMNITLGKVRFRSLL